ncbi:hypothetical protein VTJ04DRAFT_9922 [Mycothermus thermophilus]|uniref:uncharacterized protein n=1 Tax=Humicola insolens TaxID=85995 RepID=UPI0037430824
MTPPTIPSGAGRVLAPACPPPGPRSVIHGVGNQPDDDLGVKCTTVSEPNFEFDGARTWNFLPLVLTVCSWWSVRANPFLPTLLPPPSRPCRLLCYLLDHPEDESALSLDLEALELRTADHPPSSQPYDQRYPERIHASAHPNTNTDLRRQASCCLVQLTTTGSSRSKSTTHNHSSEATRARGQVA